MRIHDRGSASLEFVVVALGVLLPVLAITVSTSAIQRAQFAVTEIARQGVRAAALSPSNRSAERVVARIARLTLEDFTIDGTARLRISCEPASCRAQGALVRVTASITVPLAMIPALPGLDVLTRIPVTATATHRAPLPVQP